VDFFLACRKECWILLLRIGDFVKGFVERAWVWPRLAIERYYMCIDGVIDLSELHSHSTRIIDSLVTLSNQVKSPGFSERSRTRPDTTSNQDCFVNIERKSYFRKIFHFDVDQYYRSKPTRPLLESRPKRRSPRHQNSPQQMRILRNLVVKVVPDRTLQLRSAIT
jgi:hypothetical protein